MKTFLQIFHAIFKGLVIGLVAIVALPIIFLAAGIRIIGRMARQIN